MSVKIGIIAGTPIDTQMGVDLIKKKGFEAEGVHTAANPEEQTVLQFLYPNLLTQKVIDIISDFEIKGIYRTIIYCNSLSSSIDLKKVRAKQPKTLLVTPLDIYCRLARNYTSIMLWAANAQSLAGIEKVFYEHNPSIQILGLSMLPVVEAIEKLNLPEDIIEQFNMSSMAPRLPQIEALVLGCTHFPYLKDKLSVSFEVIDPTEKMLEVLMEYKTN